MELNGKISVLPSYVKVFIGIFLVVLSVGYFTGLTFVRDTTGTSAQGIQENYLGNEDDEAASVMKFKKTEREMLTIVHTHILSMSVIFFLLGGLVAFTRTNPFLKKLVMVEPLVSVVLTFGGIYGMWKGILWLKHIVMISGMLMTLSFIVGVALVMRELFRK